MAKIKNNIQLITYADSLGGDLKNLKKILDQHFRQEIKGVHILPFYPSSADRGFAPLTHFEVDPKFGTWEDIKAIAKEYDLACDFVLNHVSSESMQFQDYLQKGDASKYADWFISTEKYSRNIDGRLRKKMIRLIGKRSLFFLEKIMNKLRQIDFVFHRSGVRIHYLKKIYRPRLGDPFVEFKLAGKYAKKIWCTFSKDQIDWDVENPGVKRLFIKCFQLFQELGVKLLRFDSSGYVIKKKGTSSFLIPETYKYITKANRWAKNYNLVNLHEVRHHYTSQLRLSKTDEVDYVYDFALPFLVIHSLVFGEVRFLKKWLEIRPSNCINVLDTHDGIGVSDIEDLLPKSEVENVVKVLCDRGGDIAWRSVDPKSDRKDIYQINMTYFSAMECEPDSYIAARAIQFFVPGIPQVYYVGLLAGKNDMALWKKTGISREINRHNYTLEEVENNLKKPVVQRLGALMKLRNEHPAFFGKFRVLRGKGDIFRCCWKKSNDYCELIINLSTKKAKIIHTDQRTKELAVYWP